MTNACGGADGVAHPIRISAPRPQTTIKPPRMRGEGVSLACSISREVPPGTPLENAANSDIRGGSGFSDTGISGFRARARRDRRDEIHEEATTQPLGGVQGAGGIGSAAG